MEKVTQSRLLLRTISMKGTHIRYKMTLCYILCIPFQFSYHLNKKRNVFILFKSNSIVMTSIWQPKKKKNWCTTSVWFLCFKLYIWLENKVFFCIVYHFHLCSKRLFFLDMDLHPQNPRSFFCFVFHCLPLFPHLCISRWVMFLVN